MWVILGRAYVALMLMGNAYVMKHRNEDKAELSVDADVTVDVAGSYSDATDPLNTPPIIAHVMPARSVSDSYRLDDNPRIVAYPVDVAAQMKMGAMEKEILI
jgi:hypothetical protein